MARMSYAGEIFSPVRSDTTFNEDVSNSGKESDCSFEPWKESFVMDKNITNKKNKQKPFCKGIVTVRRPRVSISEEEEENRSAKNDLTDESKSAESLFGNSTANDSSLEVSLPKNSFITTRSRKSHPKTKNTKEASKIKSTSQTSAVENKRHKNRNQDNAISRSEKNPPVEMPVRKFGQSSCVPSMPSLAEEHPERNHFTKPIASDNRHKDESSCRSGINTSNELSLQIGGSQNVNVSPHTPISNLKDGREKKLGSRSGEVIRKSESSLLTVDCETQTDLVTELNAPSGRGTIEKLDFNQPINPSANALNLQSYNQSQQIQANVIEKLVKDTVSFEFDSIRQMLYLQQLSIFKHLDRNAEAEKQNTIDCNTLLNIVDTLMEENRKLREMVIASQSI